MKNIIEIEHLSKSFKDVKAVKDLSFRVKEGEFFAFLGINGAGKSTTISIMCGELPSDSGSVIVDGISIDNHKEHISKSVGVVFQNFRLLPKKTVFENVAYALEVIDTPRVEIRRRVRATLELVGLEDKVNAFPHELSGGQQQRVAIARAIVNRPKVLIADEPTGNLDPETSKEIINVLMRINEEQGTTVLVVTHDQKIVQEHKKRTILMEDGCINADTSLGGYDL